MRCYEKRGSELMWGQLLNAIWNHHTPFIRLCFLLGIWCGVILVHFANSRKRNKERNFSRSKQNKIRSWVKTHYTLLEAGSFLFVGKEHCKQSSRSAVKAENIFDLVRISQPLLWVNSSLHILTFLVVLLLPFLHSHCIRDLSYSDELHLDFSPRANFQHKPCKRKTFTDPSFLVFGDYKTIFLCEAVLAPVSLSEALMASKTRYPAASRVCQVVWIHKTHKA